jgi:uncharacterized protein (UPF0332 family)
MFPYKESLQIAKDLASHKSDAHLRSSVSRAYYACFHAIREFAVKEGINLRGTRDEHTEIIAYLHNHANLDFQTAGDFQSRLRKARRACDYDDNVKHLADRAEESLKNADNVFSALGDL